MATTTNYGWTTPDDTALVKDGAAAIRSLGSAIDTTTKNLNPGTTNGDIDYYATGTTKSRVAIGSSGQCLTVVAGVPSWAASPTSVLTTTGDLLYASAANTLARRAIGSTGDVLTVSGGVPTWAAPASGSLTLLSTTTLSGTSTTISGISSAYTHLQVVISAVNINTSSTTFRVAPNGSTTITQNIRFDGTSGLTQNNGTFLWLHSSGRNVTFNNTNNLFVLTIYNYSASTVKGFQVNGQFNDPTNLNEGILNMGGINTTSAISSLVFSNGAGNSFAAGTVLVYGVK